MISREDAEKLLKSFKVPEIVELHCKQVNKIVLWLADKAEQKGLAVDKALLDSASLLHDLFRPIEFVNDPNRFSQEEIMFWQEQAHKYGSEHCEAAYNFFRLNHPKLAQLIKSHKTKYVIEGYHDLNEKILKYSDLRVVFNRIVSLHERLEDGLKRHNIPQHERVPVAVFENFEKELSETLSFRPEEILEL